MRSRERQADGGRTSGSVIIAPMIDKVVASADEAVGDRAEGVDELQRRARLLGVEVLHQLHRALDVGEQCGDGLALALDGASRGEDALGQRHADVRNGLTVPPEIEGTHFGETVKTLKAIYRRSVSKKETGVGLEA